MIGLVDCNNFYASCERVFRPDLIGKPIVVLSNNDGCIIARSDEAKIFKIPMAAPAHKWIDKIEKNNIHVFSSNYPLYGDLSQRVMNILARFTPEVEVYSIDEAFLFLDGVPTPDLVAADLVQKVKRWIGIPISIGVAPTKTLAKAANRIAKKFPELNNSYVIDTEEKRIKALKWMDIRAVWGIGNRNAKKMEYYGIRTAYDFTQKTDSFVRKHFTVMGLRTKRELQGERCLEFEHQPPAKKSIATTRSFAEMQTALPPIEEAICHYTELNGHKLRKKKLCASTIMVFLTTNSYQKLPQYSAGFSATFPTPTNNSTEMIRYAKETVQKIYKSGYQYKKAGVVVAGLIPEDQVQLNIFDEINRPKYQHLYKIIDHLNESYGRQTISIASSKGSRKWKLKQEKLSKRFTTRWDDLLDVE